jgi:hypothetical protein
MRAASQDAEVRKQVCRRSASFDLPEANLNLPEASLKDFFW